MESIFDNLMDDFLQGATLSVRELWENAGGMKLGEFETQALNDLLTAFFADKTIDLNQKGIYQ